MQLRCQTVPKRSYAVQKNILLALINQAKSVCMGESWPRSSVQTKGSEVCTHNRSQDSPIQTDLAWLIRCLLYGKNKNILIHFINVTGLY